MREQSGRERAVAAAAVVGYRSALVAIATSVLRGTLSTRARPELVAIAAPGAVRTNA